MAVMLYCQWCNKTYDEGKVEFRKEDNTFSAPFGSLKVVIGGSVDWIPLCPDCGEDLEEVE